MLCTIIQSMKSNEKQSVLGCIQEGFKRLLDFEGRSGRREYLVYVIFLFILFVILFVAAFLLFEIPNEVVPYIVDGFLWGFTLLLLSATFRRFQDVGLPGYYALLIPASWYFLTLIRDHPFEWSGIVQYVCLGILTFCFVWLVRRSKE